MGTICSGPSELIYQPSCLDDPLLMITNIRRFVQEEVTLETEALKQNIQRQYTNLSQWYNFVKDTGDINDVDLRIQHLLNVIYCLM